MRRTVAVALTCLVLSGCGQESNPVSNSICADLRDGTTADEMLAEVGERYKDNGAEYAAWTFTRALEIRKAVTETCPEFKDQAEMFKMRSALD